MEVFIADAERYQALKQQGLTFRGQHVKPVVPTPSKVILKKINYSYAPIQFNAHDFSQAYNAGGHSQPSDPTTSSNLVAAEKTQLTPKETKESEGALEASEERQATPEPTEGEHQAEPMDFTTENLNAPSFNINTPRQLTEKDSESQESDGETDSQGSDDDEPQQYVPITQRISARVKQAMNYNLQILDNTSPHNAY
ncbi:hypothetical protein BGX27_003095 [Mortierella sp. AM989]|nr:hypothetical protein BGX27_003095 [Mortierella sp. AM989]